MDDDDDDVLLISPNDHRRWDIYHGTSNHDDWNDDDDDWNRYDSPYFPSMASYPWL